jgi:hypothetical protein
MARSLSIVIIASNPPRRWHARLAAALQRAGHAVTFEVEASRRAQLKGFELLLQLESFAYGARSSAFEESEAGTDGAGRDRGDDVRIDLRDAPVLNENESTLLPLFDGAPGESALVAALLDKRAPEITIAHSGAALRVVAHGLPALENPNIMSYGLDHVLARVVDLLAQSVERIARGEKMKGGRAVIGDRKDPRPLLFAATGLATKITQRLTQLAVHPEHWRIAFRALAGTPTIEGAEWADASWTIVPDDNQRFFADPFPFVENGRAYIFCEEYPYATRKAIISVFEVVDGKPTPARAVLERPYHLSYPFVFRRGANVYMIPETSSAGRIELYRAESFPDRWTFERVLVHDVIASDATLVAWQGRDWLFASIAGDAASTWDALGLFYADDLLSEWRPHPLNPVLIDARSARPGGAMVEMNGRLRRIAQDCHAMYGGAIVIADVERLDPEIYAQTVRAVLGPPRQLHGRGAHTLNTAPGIEAIDVVGPVRRSFRQQSAG